MKSVIKTFILIATYLVGQFSYDTIYSWTLKAIKYFTEGKIQFFGKLWDFMGNPYFGLVLLLLPILGFLATILLKINRQIDLLKYWVTDFIFIGITYFAVCYVYGQYLLNQIKEGKIVAHNYDIHLHNVNLFTIGTFTISLGTSATFIFYKFTLLKKDEAAKV